MSANHFQKIVLRKPSILFFAFSILSTCCPLLLTGCFPFLGSRSANIPEPSSAEPTPIPNLEPSFISANISWPIRWVQGVAESNIPHESIGAHAWGRPIDGNDKIETRHAIRRRPLSFSADGNTASLDAAFVFKLKGRYKVFSNWGPSVSCAWDSDDAFDPPSVSGRIKISSSFSPQPDWSIGSHTYLANLDLGECRVSFANINASGLLKSIVSKNITNKLEDVDRDIHSRLQLKERFRTYWNKFNQPITFSGNAAFSLNAKRVITNGINMSNDSIFLRVGIVSTPTICIGCIAQYNPTPLPDLEVGNIDSTSTVRLSVAATDSLIGSSISKGVVGLKIERRFWFFKFHSKVTKAEFFGIGDKAVVKLRLDGKINGNIYVTAAPEYNAATHILSFRDIDFTSESKNLLSRLAFKYGKEKILDEIRSRSRFDLSSQIELAKDKLEKVGNIDFNIVHIRFSLHELIPLGVFRIKNGFAAIINIRATGRLIGISP